MLQALGATSEDTAPDVLTDRQRAELRWSIPCAECGSIPEGPIVRDGVERVEFRCPFKRCGSTDLQARSLLLSYGAVRDWLDSTGRPLDEAVSRALQSDVKTISSAPTDVRRCVVRVPAGISKALSNSELEKRIHSFLESRHAQRR
jgi:hypothetical protein